MLFSLSCEDRSRYKSLALCLGGKADHAGIIELNGRKGFEKGKRKKKRGREVALLLLLLLASVSISAVLYEYGCLICFSS